MESGDRMYCHACGGVWQRNGDNMVCPHCQSDFTEIVEIPPDPEEDFPDDDFPDPPTSVPDGPNPFAGHDPYDPPHLNPYQQDPDDGWRYHSYRSPDGRMSVSVSSYNSARGHQRSAPASPMMPMVQGIDAIFRGLAETYQRAEESRQMNERLRARHEFRAGGDASFTTHNDGGINMRWTRVHPAGSPLRPRDSDGPQPMHNPLDSLGGLLEMLRAEPTNDPTAGGARPGPNPLELLASLLNLSRNGDAVYSQEELDRVISQLVDQTANGSSVPPASENAIRSLPTKKVDEEMLGREGRAECSICMDAAELGSEVTVLPCKHWFHTQCIELWLTQHNTCPHCRRGIDDPQAQHPSQDPSQPPAGNAPQSPHRRSPQNPPQNQPQYPQTPPRDSSQGWYRAHPQSQPPSQSRQPSNGFSGAFYTPFPPFPFLPRHMVPIFAPVQHLPGQIHYESSWQPVPPPSLRFIPGRMHLVTHFSAHHFHPLQHHQQQHNELHQHAHQHAHQQAHEQAQRQFRQQMYQNLSQRPPPHAPPDGSRENPVVINDSAEAARRGSSTEPPSPGTGVTGGLAGWVRSQFGN